MIYRAISEKECAFILSDLLTIDIEKTIKH